MEELKIPNSQPSIPNDLISSKLSKIDTLVLSGGSILGLTYLGLFQKISESFPNFLNGINEFYGTSIGAVVSVFFAMGFQPQELFDSLGDISIEPNIDILHFTSTFGLDSGDSAIDFLVKILQSKCSENIRELTLDKFFQLTNKTVNITTCCAETGEVLILSHKTFPNLKLVHALRMTISIPIYFTPVIWKGKHYIDAGVTLNFPFKPEFYSKENVLGVNLQRKFSSDDTLNVFSYISNVISLVVAQKPEKSDNIITLVIPPSIKNKEIYNFNVSPELKKKLFNIGYSYILTSK